MPPVSMPCSSRPVFVFKRVLPGSCGSAGNPFAPPHSLTKHASFSTARWLLPTHYPLRNPRLTIFEHLLAGLGRRLVSTWTRLRDDLKVAKRHCCVDAYRICKIHSDRPRPTGMAPSGVSSCHVDPAANPANRDDPATLPAGFWHDRSGMNQPMAAVGGPRGQVSPRGRRSWWRWGPACPSPQSRAQNMRQKCHPTL